MKSATTLLLAIALCAPASARLLAQEQPSGAPREMSDYYFGFLFNGPNWSAEETEELAQRQEAHLAYLRSLFEAGNLVACGPTFSKEDFRGVVIFKTATLGEARALADSDPHIRAGYFRLELLPWRGTAGIGQNWAKWTVNPDELTSYQPVHAFKRFQLLPMTPPLAREAPALRRFCLSSGCKWYHAIACLSAQHSAQQAQQAFCPTS